MQNWIHTIRQKKGWFLGLRLLLLVLLFSCLYWQLFRNEHLKQSLDLFRDHLRSGSSPAWWLALLLMPVNWGVEALKWQHLISKTGPLSWFRSFKAVLCGIAFSVFTPNRVGEFAGRLFYLDRHQPGRQIAVTLVGTLAQITATAICGLLACFVYVLQFKSLPTPLHQGLEVFFLLLTLLIPVLYYNVERVHRWLLQFRLFQPLEQSLRILSDCQRSTYHYILFLSLFRYGIFSFQYLLLLWFFGIPIPWETALMIVPLIYLVQTLIPTITLLEPSVRGNVALFFLIPYTSNSLGIVAAAISIWLMNLILPALAGTLIIGLLRNQRT